MLNRHKIDNPHVSPILVKRVAMVVTVGWLVLIGFFVYAFFEDVFKEVSRLSKAERLDGIITRVEEKQENSNLRKIFFTYKFRDKGYSGISSVSSDSFYTIDDEWKRQPYKLEPDQKINVWIEPEKPEKSFLDPLPDLFNLVLIMFFIPFITGPLFLFWNALTVPPDKYFRSFRMNNNPSPFSRYGMVYGWVCAFSAIGYGILSTVGSSVISWKGMVMIAVGWIFAFAPFVTFLLVRIGSRKSEDIQPSDESTNSVGAFGMLSHLEPVESEIPSHLEPVSRVTVKSKGNLLASGLFLFGILWGMATMFFVWFMLINPLIEFWDVNARYKETTGTVLSSEVKEEHFDGTSYKPGITYEYMIKEKKYVSSRVTVDDSSFGKATSDAVVALYPEGKSIKLYFDPDEPEKALLDKGLPYMYIYGVLFMQPFIFIAIAFIWGGIGFWKTGKQINILGQSSDRQLPHRIPEWGVIEYDGPARFHIKKQDRTLCTGSVFIGTHIAICFVAVFIIAFGEGLLMKLGMSHNSISCIFLLFSLCCASVLAIWLYRRDNKNAELIVDRKKQELYLSSSKRKFGIHFSEIAYWFVETRIIPGDESDTTLKFLALCSNDGIKQIIHIFNDDKDSGFINKTGLIFANITGSLFYKEKDGLDTVTTTETEKQKYSDLC